MLSFLKGWKKMSIRSRTHKHILRPQGATVLDSTQSARATLLSPLAHPLIARELRPLTPGPSKRAPQRNALAGRSPDAAPRGSTHGCVHEMR